jgi:hypothetical protein
MSCFPDERVVNCAKFPFGPVYEHEHLRLIRRIHGFGEDVSLVP